MTAPPGPVAFDVDGERAVIGAVLHSAGRLLDRLGLTGDDFAHPAHTELWAIMAGLAAAGQPVEPGTVLAASPRPQVHGPALLACVDVPTASPDHWAARLRALHARRRVAEAGTRLLQLAADDQRDPDDLADTARGLVDAATTTSGPAAAASATLDDTLTAGLERWCVPDTRVTPTGWVDLDDRLTGGLRPGHLVIVGARPAVGKSLLATELAANAARAGVGVLFCSLEMSAAEVTDRIASSRSKVPLEALVRGTATDEQMADLAAFHGLARGWPLHIDDRTAAGIPGIRGRARDLTRRPGGLGLVIVDYVQLVAPADRRAPREQQVAGVSRALKLLARDLQVPVVALAQVNRGPTGRENRRPAMSDLRESGSLEADADEVLLLHREDETGELEVNVAKNRHGTCGPVHLGWSPHLGRITNLTRTWQETA